MKIISHKTDSRRHRDGKSHGEAPVYFPFKNLIDGSITFGITGTDGRTYRVTLNAADVGQMREFFVLSDAEKLQAEANDYNKRHGKLNAAELAIQGSN